MFCWLRLLHARESAAWLVCNLRTKLLEEDCNCWGLHFIKTDVVNNLPRCKFFEHRLIGESGAPIMQRIESINAQRIQQQTAFNDQTWKECIDAQRFNPQTSQNISMLIVCLRSLQPSVTTRRKRSKRRQRGDRRNTLAGGEKFQEKQRGEPGEIMRENKNRYH